jgi:hypothetical protein
MICFGNHPELSIGPFDLWLLRLAPVGIALFNHHVGKGEAHDDRRPILGYFQIAAMPDHLPERAGASLELALLCERMGGSDHKAADRR